MALGTRSPNFRSFRVTAPSGGYTVNTMAKVEDTVVCFPSTIAEGDVGAAIYSCEKVVLPKATGVTFAAGDKVYFDATAGNLTSVTTDNTLCGRALVAAGTAATEAEVDFDGTAA